MIDFLLVSTTVLVIGVLLLVGAPLTPSADFQKWSNIMPKFYVESGQVQVVLDALDAQQAAITAFQWWCDQQAEVMFGGVADECQLGNEILVSEIGFGAVGAETFPTLDILMAWQVEPVEVA